MSVDDNMATKSRFFACQTKQKVNLLQKFVILCCWQKRKFKKAKSFLVWLFFRCVSASDKCGKGRQTDRQVSPSTWVQFTLSEMSAACSEPQVASCIWLDICLSDSRCVEGREATSPCCSYHNNYMAETMGTKCAGGTTSNNDIKQWHSAIVAPTTSHPPSLLPPRLRSAL